MTTLFARNRERVIFIMNRLFDIFISLVGLLLLLLMLPWIALLIKLDSRGPVFFLCNRVGLGGKIFKMYKFRTMYQTPLPLGGSVSPQGDPRVTPVGCFLRRVKLNEFPQFINVLKGDMTLIGPRPEAPDLAALYPASAQRIFSVKPGLAGPNQILGRNEEELYPPGEDPIKYYIEHILPRKLPLDLEYINDSSFVKNLKYLFLSVKVTISGAISRQHLVENTSQILFILADIILCISALTLAHYLRYDSFSKPFLYQYFVRVLPWALLIRIPIFIYFGFYRTLIRHLSFYDIKVIFKGVTVSSLVLIGFFFFSRLEIFAKYGRGVFLIDWFCLINLLAGYRILLKKLFHYYKAEANGQENQRRVLIWGAGDAGELCLRYLQKEKGNSYETIGFIDDDPKKRSYRLNGVKVLGNRDHVTILVQLYKIQEIFVAMPSAEVYEIKKALEICNSVGVDARLFQLSATTYSKPSPDQVYVSQVDKSLSPSKSVIDLSVATNSQS
jgi:lipopolysaccharide/colanic/teichoic acid biosynthesis glycosyltransferase